MRIFSFSLAAALAVGVSTPALAQSDNDRAGTVQVKILGTAVLPDGEIGEVEVDDFGLPVGSQAKATDEFIPSFAIEYYLTNNISVETIAGAARHNVVGTDALDGVELVDDLRLVPATVTAKAHLDIGENFKPYVGAGVAYFMYFAEDEGSGIAQLGVNDADLSNEFGFALQAGADISLGDNGLGLSFDAKRYFMTTDASFRVNDTEIIRTEHNLDPWLLSAGVYFTF